MKRDVCRNPRCQERMMPWQSGLTGLCPSCQLAGRWGAGAAFAAWAAWKLLTLWIG